MQAVLNYTKTYKLTRVRVPSMHLWLILMGQVLVLVVMLFALVQPAIAKDLKPELSLDDRAAIMKLADRVEAAFLIPDAHILSEIVRPEHGLFIDLLSDSCEPILVHIPFNEVPHMFSDFEEKYWGPHDAADFDLYGAIPNVLLGGFIHLVASLPEDKDLFSQIVSLPQVFSRYDSKQCDELSVKPLNHRFIYENEHYVQYFIKDLTSEMNGHYWFLIVDKDEDGWFLKGITHMERLSM